MKDKEISDVGSSQERERLSASKRGRKKQRALELTGERTRRLPGLGQRLMRKMEVFRALLEQKDLSASIQPSAYAREVFFRTGLGVQRRIVHHFSSYVDLLYKLDRKGIDITDSKRVLWAFLREQGLQPSANLFLSIQESDVVEVYNRESVQIFRDLNFFRFFDCSLFDLLILDWMTVFKRQAVLEEKLFFRMEACMKGPSGVFDLSDMEKHSLKYRFDEEAKSTSLQLKFMSPLKNRSKKRRSFEAVLLVSEATSETLSEGLFSRERGIV